MKVYLKTNHPIALSSYDYLYPLGNIYGWKENDCSQKFNDKLLKRFPGDILDLGCSSGSFVKSCLDDNRNAFGLEGNDYGFKHKWGDWATIPNNLFLGDITFPFILHTGNNLPHQFGIITAWEVLEHIEKKDLPQLFININNHLSRTGIFITSISNKPSLNKKFAVDLHRIHEDERWWTERLLQAGFVRDKETESYFGSDWVRRERKSFHLVLKKYNILH